jgi:hypothetical protein
VTELVIDQLRERYFILCHLGGEFYAFVHRGFLEYFCAEEIRNSVAREPSTAVERLKVIFAGHCKEDAWKEVLVLTANALEPTVADQVLAPLVDSETDEDSGVLWISYAVLTRARDPMALAKTERATRGKLGKNIFTTRSWRALDALASFWRDDTTRQLLTSLTQNSADSMEGSAAVSSLAQHWRDEPRVE